MNILFDLSSTQPVHGNDFHGGGEYAKTVFKRLCELLPSGMSLEVFYNPDKNIESSTLEICKKLGVSINPCKNNFDLSQLLSAKKYDVFIVHCFTRFPAFIYHRKQNLFTRFMDYALWNTPGTDMN